MPLRKEVRGETDRGIEARRLFTIRELVYIVSAFVGMVATGTGSSFLTNNALTSEAVNQIRNNTTAIQMLSKDFSNYRDSARELNVVKDNGTKMQFDNIINDIGELKESQKELIKAVNRLISKSDK